MMGMRRIRLSFRRRAKELISESTQALAEKDAVQASPPGGGKARKCKDGGNHLAPKLVLGDLVSDRALRRREEDRFGHAEIAERVADLLDCAETPLNVALFGPWGSGKSSFCALLQEEIEKRTTSTKFIAYDAWKYGGEALQRSFLLDVAEALDEDDHVSVSTLRHDVERNQIGLKHVDGKQLRALAKWSAYLVLPVLAAAIGLALSLIAAVSWATNRSVGRELLHYVPIYILGPTLFAGVATTFVKLLWDAATVKVREGPPTEEGFENRFCALLEAGKSKGFTKFVFFVDELDRAGRRQVVDALQVIKGFLDQDDTAFVVAADPDVIEQALDALPQATPTNEDEPYYSSASAFLDKVFQYQIALPPVRGQKLTSFARDLARETKDGLWEELRNADVQERQLGAVIFALIPSHVRSPRRVKVLMNSFAVNARIAESRSIDWLVRAPEIAKLTALEIEFPLFAADLHVEPRLPTLLLDPPASGLSWRTKRLLARHRLEPIEAHEIEDEDEVLEEAADQDEASAQSEPSAQPGALTPTDRLLVPRDAQAPLIGVQRQNLRRYLRRTETIHGPGRDILFLEPGGLLEGLEDAELGELIEDEAVDDPGAVVEATRTRSVDEKRRVVAVLSGVADQEWGEERSNVVDALLGVADDLDFDLGDVLARATESLSSFDREEGFGEDQLAAALGVGLAASREGDTGLRDSVLGDERLLSTAERTRQVAEHFDELDDENAVRRVTDAIAVHFADDSSVLNAPIRNLPASAAAQVLRAPGILRSVQAVLNDLDEDAADELVVDLIAALETREEPAPLACLRLLWILSGSSGPLYQRLYAFADGVDRYADPVLANSVALRMLLHAPVEHWEDWLGWLDPSEEPTPEQKARAAETLNAIFAELDAPGEAPVGELIKQVIAVGRLSDAEFAEIEEGVSTYFASSWWVDDASSEAEVERHRAVRALDDMGPHTTAALSSYRHQSLARGLASGVTITILRTVGAAASGLSGAELTDLATRLRAVPDPPDENVAVELLSAFLAVHRAAKKTDANTREAPYTLPVSLMVAVGRARGDRASDVVSQLFTDWRPQASAGLGYIAGIARGPRPREVSAYTAWLQKLQGPARQEVMSTLLDDPTDRNGLWIAMFANAQPRRYDEEALVGSIVSRVKAATRANDRRNALKPILWLNPDAPGAQRQLAELVIWLLERKQKGDFESAVILMGALGNRHGAARRIANRFRSVMDSEGWRVPATSRGAFAEAGVNLAKAYFQGAKRKPFWKR